MKELVLILWSILATSGWWILASWTDILREGGAFFIGVLTVILTIGLCLYIIGNIITEWGQS